MFFFFKQKTAYEMCGRDWSSDVCSSDLPNVDWTIIVGSAARIKFLLLTQSILCLNGVGDVTGSTPQRA